MAVILTDNTFNGISLCENDRILIQISLKYIPGSAIDNNPALVQVMTWGRTDNKPSPGPVMRRLIN